MAEEKTKLQQTIESGKQILVAEISPPTSSDPAAVSEPAARFAGKVHALGISDNRDRVCMSALAAASLTAAAGVEPILHVVTRDRNRIALLSEYLGARALGIGNLLCTTGRHQTLGRFRAAKNVFDVDAIQLLQIYAGIGQDGSIVGEKRIDGAGSACLGAVATPYADPVELQVMRIAKKIAAGATFLISQPVYDVERFQSWWKEVSARGLHEKAAIVAGIRPLTDAEGARAAAEAHPRPGIPEQILQRMDSKSAGDAQRAEGLKIARETIERLAACQGLRGFQICAEQDADAAVQLIEQSGLEAS